jgi:hypothetical protein
MALIAICIFAGLGLLVLIGKCINEQFEARPPEQHQPDDTKEAS